MAQTKIVETLIISLGSNMGNRIAQLTDAVLHLKLHFGRIVRVSPVYETAPWGFEAEQDFLNCTLTILTELPADECLVRCQQIEGDMGRIRSDGVGYMPRPIDIDILFYGKQVFDSSRLKIPHPRLHLRKFVLIPLCQTEPEFIHPVFNRSVSQLYNECRDTADVRFFAESGRIFNPNH